MSDDVRCLLRLPRQWQLQVWRWVPFQPRSIGCMCRIHVWTKLLTWDSYSDQWKLCCSHVLVQSLGTYMYWTCMYLIHCLDPFPSFPSWTGKCEPDRCHLQRCRGQASRWEKDFAFLEKSLQAAAFHVMNFSAIQPCPCIRRGVLWQTGPSLRHQPVVQAILIASVHDTVALCTILHNLALCHI